MPDIMAGPKSHDLVNHLIEDIIRHGNPAGFDVIAIEKSFNILSQPNNNHNPNNKTTITVVGLRQSNCWEPPPPTRNSKLPDRAKLRKQKLLVYIRTPQNSF